MHRPSSSGGTAQIARPQAQALSQGRSSQQEGGMYRDAYQYLMRVKEKFRERREVYDNFLDTMKSFKHGRITTIDVIERVKKLFRGHKELVLEFNMFVPERCKITEAEIDFPDSDEAVKAAAARSSHKGVVRNQQENNSGGSARADTRVGTATTTNIGTTGNNTNNNNNKTNNNNTNSTSRNKESGSVGRSKPATAPSSESGQQAFAPSTGQHIDFEKAIKFVNKIKATFVHDQSVYKKFLDILNRYRKNAKTINQVDEEVSELFQDYPQLLSEFHDFLPPEQKTNRRLPPISKKAEEKKPGKKPLHGAKQAGKGKATVRKSVTLAQDRENHDVGTQQRAKSVPEHPVSPFSNQLRELQVFDKMRSRLRSNGTYTEFLKCVDAFNKGALTKMELESLTFDLIGKHSDLYSLFSELIVRCESLDSDEVSKKEGNLTQDDIPKMKPVQGREQYLRTPTSELDLNACQKAGESYRLLPQEFPRAPAKGRTYLCNRVLNEDWVNVTSGSEDYSYKSMRKNQYEEALFRCEDDRFELDMVIETTKSAIGCLEEIKRSLQERSGDRRTLKPLDPEDISPVQLRAVERIYGESKSDLREKLFRYPAVTVPTVLKRLSQKLEEWQKLQQEMEPIWAKVYEKNYSRSLDHRSFYFKQEDKRSLSQKELLREVHEHARMRRSATLGSSEGDDAADMVFVDQYRATHDDAYAILKHYLSLQMQPQDVEKMLWFWRSFVERFYNVARSHDGSALYDTIAQQAIEGANSRTKENGNQRQALEKRSDQHQGGPGTNRSPASMDDEQNATPQDEGSPSEDDNGDESQPKGVEQYNQQQSMHLHEDAQKSQSMQRHHHHHQRDEQQNPHHSAEVVEREQQRDRATAEEEEQEEEDASGNRFTGCKPVAPKLGGSELAQAEGRNEMSANAKRGSKDMFFGHDAFYILFKLHNLLLQRLAVARDSAAQADTASWKSEDANETRGPQSEHDVLTYFFELLSSLLSSIIDSTKYEDDCRSLLGAKSYVLFTLDRLVQKIYKQLQILVADDTSVKLAMLHEYETSRSVDFNQMVYQSNACMLLGPEDTCYRMSMIDRTLPSLPFLISSLVE